MAIIDIHINKKKIIDHILDTSNVSIKFAIDYVNNKKNMLGFYNMNSTHICLMLDRINETKGIFGNKTLEEKVCCCLIHEEIHHWLNENIDSGACWAFDSIAYKFMEGM